MVPTNAGDSPCHLSPPRQSLSFPGIGAAWIIEACRWADSIGAGLTIGADGFLRAVRTAVGEHKGLLEAQRFGCPVTPARKCFGLNLVEPLVIIEDADRGPAAVAVLDAN